MSAIKEADKKLELLSGNGAREETRRVIADWIRLGNGPKVDLEAAEEVKYLGLVANYPEYLLLDRSAWSRLLADRVPEDREERVLDWIDEGRLAICLPFLLEVGFSAWAADDHCEMMRRLEQLPDFPIDNAVELAALDAQHELAAMGRHRLAPANLMIAACAHVAGGGVLHYDRDYDVILEHTRLSFESVWLAEPGTI